MNCLFCNKLFNHNNKGAKKVHENQCSKNPNRKLYKTNLVKYNEQVKNDLISKPNSNQFTKAKNLGLTPPTVSIETKLKIGNANKGRKMTLEEKEMRSKAMKEAIIKNPDSYSTSNVSGRVKSIKYKNTVLKGGWELLVAKWFDLYNILWTNHISEPIEYLWNSKTHLYFPDFYLIEYDLYVEVKGYEWDRHRDLAKWKNVPNLIVLKGQCIKKIKSGVISPQDYIL